MRVAHIFLSAAAILCSACGTSPKEYFYTLNPVAEPVANAAQAGARYSVTVGPVHVPEMIDRPQLVVRQSANRVDVLEQHRWAQPLHSEIARVLAADLGSRLPDAQVTPYSGYTGRDADYRIAVDIEQFDAVPGRGVTVQAAWTVRRIAGNVTYSARSQFDEPAQAGGYEELAAAYGRALAKIGADIGNAVQSMQDGAQRQPR